MIPSKVTYPSISILKYRPFPVIGHHCWLFDWIDKIDYRHSNFFRVIRANLISLEALITEPLAFVSIDDWRTVVAFKWNFVEVKLVVEDKPALEEYMKSHKDNPVSILTELVGFDYKISISWVDDRNSFVVSVSGKDGSKKNANSTMTSWSNDLSEAIGMAGYKVVKLTHGDEWSEYATNVSDWG